MSGRTELVYLVRQWMQKAENDLKNATFTLTMSEDCPYDTVCFHAQQGVEKYLKALLVYLSVDFPKSHDIGDLILLVPTQIKIPLTVTDQEKLTDYAVTSRYPGDWELLSRSEAEEALAAANKVCGYIRTYLEKELK